MLDIAALCLVLTALVAWLNERYIRLPTTIGVMAIALLVSVSLVTLDRFGLAGTLRERAVTLVQAIDFSEVLMQGMLSVLLFAGALHIDLVRLRPLPLAGGGSRARRHARIHAHRRVVAWLVLPWIGVGLPLVYCLLFGALISPTDPIAVMSVLKSAGVPRDLELVIAGESLFNDGIGVVIFALLLAAAAGACRAGCGRVAAPARGRRRASCWAWCSATERAAC
jgi:CPA1 family monovalent cation:H+ antiporter